MIPLPLGHNVIKLSLIVIAFGQGDLNEIHHFFLA